MMHYRTKIIAAINLTMLVATMALFSGAIYLVQKKESHLEERAEVLAQIKANSQELAALSKLVADTQPEREKLLGSIVNENTVIDFLAELETIATEQGIELKTAITEKKVDAHFDILMLRLTARGSYDAVAHYLALIETLPYQTSINNVLLTRDGKSTEAPWEANFELTVVKLNLTP